MAVPRTARRRSSRAWVTVAARIRVADLRGAPCETTRGPRRVRPTATWTTPGFVAVLGIGSGHRRWWPIPNVAPKPPARPFGHLDRDVRMHRSHLGEQGLADVEQVGLQLPSRRPPTPPRTTIDAWHRPSAPTPTIPPVTATRPRPPSHRARAAARGRRLPVHRRPRRAGGDLRAEVVDRLLLGDGDRLLAGGPVSRIGRRPQVARGTRSSTPASPRGLRSPRPPPRPRTPPPAPVAQHRVDTAPDRAPPRASGTTDPRQHRLAAPHGTPGSAHRSAARASSRSPGALPRGFEHRRRTVGHVGLTHRRRSRESPPSGVRSDDPRHLRVAASPTPAAAAIASRVRSSDGRPEPAADITMSARARRVRIAVRVEVVAVVGDASRREPEPTEPRVGHGDVRVERPARRAARRRRRPDSGAHAADVGAARSSRARWSGAAPAARTT